MGRRLRRRRALNDGQRERRDAICHFVNDIKVNVYELLFSFIILYMVRFRQYQIFAREEALAIMSVVIDLPPYIVDNNQVRTTVSTVWKPLSML